jgi:MoaA/NifB/PqqE/SkfB family radical SAM enzyme
MTYSVSDVHIELTDKCQASCPMCARNYNGGAERPFVGKTEITLNDVKRWFPVEFLKSINNFYACGNYGDPILAKDCLEIFEYIRGQNSNTRLSIHTNGSARTLNWWKNLANILKDSRHDVVFGIDGYEESHVKYRRGTNWSNIIKNALKFIEHGGIAKIDCLVFEHNLEEILKFKEEMLSIGFSSVNLKYTGRFYNMTEFPVENRAGKIEYFLKPAKREETVLDLTRINKDINVWTSIVDSRTILPRCLKNKEIYVDSRGTVYPCCWVGSDMLEEALQEKLPIHSLRNKFVQNTKENFINFNNLNLKKYDIFEILNSREWEKLSTLNSNKPWTCAKNCRA